MKTALITTTINVPEVLRLYRALDPDVSVFVALDKKTPDLSSLNPNIFAVTEGTPKYSCSDLIGWNTIGRRNIALLEALKSGAELIVTIDDDNIPLSDSYFLRFTGVFSRPIHGIKVKTPWFNSSMTTTVQRGFPQHILHLPPTLHSVVDAEIGVAQGMILGDPDTSAVDRISQQPEVHRVSELLRAGIITDPRDGTYAPINSQNTAFIRELAPCFLMVPSYGRYDDIYASLVAQRVMRERNLCVHYGQPFVWQQRNPHNLLKDLAQEQWGAEHIIEFAAWLDSFNGVTDVLSFLRVMAANLPKFIPPGTQELWLAWLEDCEKVL